MLSLLVSNKVWRVFQLFIKQRQSFLGAGDAVNYSTITGVIMQRSREESHGGCRREETERALARAEERCWQRPGLTMAGEADLEVTVPERVLK